MRAKQKTVIRVETHNLSVIRPIHSSVNYWCERCQAIVEMVTPEYAAVIANTNPREIYRGIEMCQFHFVETQEGEVFICCASLQSD